MAGERKLLRVSWKGCIFNFYLDQDWKKNIYFNRCCNVLADPVGTLTSSSWVCFCQKSHYCDELWLSLKVEISVKRLKGVEREQTSCLSLLVDFLRQNLRIVYWVTVLENQDVLLYKDRQLFWKGRSSETCLI